MGKFQPKFPQTWDKVGHGGLGTAPCLQDKISRIFALHFNHWLFQLFKISLNKIERNRFVLQVSTLHFGHLFCYPFFCRHFFHTSRNIPLKKAETSPRRTSRSESTGRKNATCRWLTQSCDNKLLLLGSWSHQNIAVIGGIADDSDDQIVCIFCLMLEMEIQILGLRWYM